MVHGPVDSNEENAVSAPDHLDGEKSKSFGTKRSEELFKENSKQPVGR